MIERHSLLRKHAPIRASGAASNVLAKLAKADKYEAISCILLDRFDNDNEYEYRPCGTEYGKKQYSKIGAGNRV
jgi:hypothetical protein